MQKFPLRMKDNDLLVTELYRDPSNDQITSISVYLTPKTTSKYSPCSKVECVVFTKKSKKNLTYIEINLKTLKSSKPN